MTGIVVIVAYRPKAGREQELLEIVRNRVPTLRKEDLVTDRVPVIVRAKDGTIIEVSEWKSHPAIEEAHRNPRVLAMWDKFGRSLRLRPAEHRSRISDNVCRLRTDPVAASRRHAFQRVRLKGALLLAIGILPMGHRLEARATFLKSRWASLPKHDDFSHSLRTNRHKCLVFSPMFTFSCCLRRTV